MKDNNFNDNNLLNNINEDNNRYKLINQKKELFKYNNLSDKDKLYIDNNKIINNKRISKFIY